MIKVAYFGFGNSVLNYHFPFILKMKDKFEVKTVCYPSEFRDEKLESDYPDIHFTSNADEIYNDEEIQLVVICSPDSTHKELVMNSLTHKKHVLVEKPITRDVAEDKELFDYAKEMGCILTVNQNRRYDSDFMSVKEIIDSGVLGDIVEVISHYDYFRPHDNGVEGLGMMHGLAIHTIDQVVSYFGFANKVVSDVRSIHKGKFADDYIDLDLFYDNYKVSVKTSTAVLYDFPRFTVHGKKGSLIIPPRPHNSKTKQTSDKQAVTEGHLYYVDDKSEKQHKIITQLPNQYGLIYENLFEAITTGKETLIKPNEVLEVLTIIENALAPLKK
ncbi:MAG: Gfo/Idh/MocA family oxidoreductase [Erysipelotrichaceae bacterium]